MTISKEEKDHLRSQIAIPNSFSQVFSWDDSESNRDPKTIRRRILKLILNHRYSSTVIFRLSQYTNNRRKKSCLVLTKKIYSFLIGLLIRVNLSFNNMELSPETLIGKRVVFHHSNVTITTNATIGDDVHFYKNVLIGTKNEQAPVIMDKVKIASNTSVIGGITIGEKSIVAPGSTVVNDVEPRTVVAGIPAKYLCNVNEQNYEF